MLEHTLDTANSVLYLRPRSQLEENDFVQLARTVDPYIQQTGGLTGLIVAAHFVSSEIKHFGASELDAATQWVMNRS